MAITRSENINDWTTRYIKAQIEALDDAVSDLENYVLPGSTPVNAVAASKALTVSGLPNDRDTVTIGAKTYRFRDAIGANIAATGTLTVSGLPVANQTIVIGNKTYRWTTSLSTEGVNAGKVLTFSGLALNTETVIVGTKTYTFKTNLTEVKATGTLTLSANVTDGNSVLIGTTKYTFKEILGAAYDVKIGASASDTIDNLIAAINGAAGEGTTYGDGTEGHLLVSAAAGAGDTMTVTALLPGIAGNNIATTELSGVCSWGAGTLGSGVNSVANEVKIGADAEACIDNLVAAIMEASGKGSTYSTATTVNAECSASKASAATMDATALVAGYAGNSIACNETLTNGSWAGSATLLSGGVDPEAANDVVIGVSAEACIDNLVHAIAATPAQAGTLFGTGTVAHTQVTAVKASAATMTVTAVTTGEVGNSIATTETSTNCAFGGVTLSGGEDVQVANDVLIGVSAEATIDNLVLAITAGAGAGTNYGTGTTANATVTAVKASASSMTATAKTKGVAGNSIVIGESASNVAWAGAAVLLSGGVDGTVGSAGQIVFDTSYIYVCTADNTISDANWKKATLNAL